MNQELQDKINKAIEESMPSQVADALRQRLEEANEERAMLEIARQSTKLEAASAKNWKESSDAWKEKHNAVVDAHAALDKREAEIMARETQLEVVILKAKLEAEQKVSQRAWDFMQVLARNPIV